MQKILKSENLLNDKSKIEEYGYDTTFKKEFIRSKIKKHKLKIKEWDYYYFGNDEFGIALTIADNTYMSLTGISFFDFKKKINCTKNFMKFFTNGKTNMPSTSKVGNIEIKTNKYHIAFLNDGKNRKLYGYVKDFYMNSDLSFHLDVKPTINNSLVIITPFKKKDHFYYNQKINLLAAFGYIKFLNQTLKLNNFYGLLDWGRGVWTYKNTWYWSSLSYYEEKTNKFIGFNLGYGFGILDNATENIIFINDEYIKLNKVEFIINKDENNKEDFLKPWIIKDDANILNLTFTPIMDRFSDSNIIIVRSLQHQVFGKFSGTITYNDEILEINNKLGFAEKVYNRW